MNLARQLIMILLFTYAAAIHATPIMVDTEWLHKHMGNADVVLVDMSSDATQYQRFHIPGAVYLGYGNLVQKRKKDKVSFRIDDQRLYKILGILGITRQSHIVIYDDMGGLNAGRFYWQLERIGHPRVSIVDGGLVKWILEGRKVDNRNVTRKPARYVGDNKIINNEIDLAGVTRALASGSDTLVDVRSKEEYAGHPKFKRTGHIPGAHLLPWDESVAFEQGFVLKSQEQLQQRLTNIGIKDKDQSLILYCNSGHRASQTYLTLKYLGYKNIKLYDGSMAEYTRDKKAPIKQGLKP